jgi:hypothetical protein
MVQSADVFFSDRFLVDEFVKMGKCFAMAYRFIMVLERLPAYGNAVFDYDLCFGLGERIAFKRVTGVGQPYPVIAL